MAENGWSAARQGGVARTHRGDAEKDEPELQHSFRPANRDAVQRNARRNEGRIVGEDLRNGLRRAGETRGTDQSNSGKHAGRRPGGIRNGRTDAATFDRSKARRTAALQLVFGGSE